MKLIVAHQILIATAILLGIGFGVRGISLFWTKGDPFNAAVGLGSIIVAAVLTGYLRGVRAKYLAEKAEKK